MDRPKDRPESFASRVRYPEKERFCNMPEEEKYNPAPPELQHTEIPETLPIAEKKDEIIAALRDCNVVLICGETGSGKTTQLGKLAYLAGCRRIGCTQPRRIAATALARRVAEECQVTPGEEVGYKVRFDSRCGPRTILKFMTDGILLAETAHDPDLRRYDCVIVDEAHERTLNIDFLLGYLKNLLRKRHDLKVIISSATLESEKIREFFPGSALVEVGGRLFPVENYYLPPESEEAEWAEEVSKAAAFLTDLAEDGDILVFLPGEREIRDCAELLKAQYGTRNEILPLFGRLSGADQDKVFRPGNRRRIVLATNVAETSLTIPRIGFVIDTGLVRVSRYSPTGGIQLLRTEFISQASAKQRAGRCGRIREGVCVRLYKETELSAAPLFTTPEIQRASLAGVILKMAALHLPPIDRFDFIDPPGMRLIKEGVRTLTDLGLISPAGRLTRDGHIAAAMPIDPKMAKMLLEGGKRRVLDEMIVIAANLSIPDVRERPFDDPAPADAAHKAFYAEDSDFLSILKLHQAARDAMQNAPQGSSGMGALRRFCRKNYLNFRRMREWFNLIGDLCSFAEDNHWHLRAGFDWEKSDPASIHTALLAALPRNLAHYDPENGCYCDMNGKKFTVFPGSALAKRKKPLPWILFFTIAETSRLFGRTVGAAAPEMLEEAAPHLLKVVYDNVSYDRASGFVRARERKLCGIHTIVPGRRCHYGSVAPEEARHIFIADGLAKGEIDPGVSPAVDRYLARYAFFREMELRARTPDRMVDEAALKEFFEAKLPDNVNSVADLRRLRVFPEPDLSLFSGLSRDAGRRFETFGSRIEEELRRMFPDFVRWGGLKLPLEYRFSPGEEGDGVTVLVHEEDLPSFPVHAPEHLVPGLLPEKIECMLRKLPKESRKQLMPVSDAAALFMAAYEEGRYLAEGAIADALADFLKDEYGIQAYPADWQDMPMPEFLKMKIAVIDAHNRRRPPVYELDPALCCSSGSRLGTGLRQVRKLHRECLTAFPDPPLPETVIVRGGVEAFPALVKSEDGESVGVETFLKSGEAHSAHEEGVLALYRMELAGVWKLWKKSVKVSNEIKLSFFLNYPEFPDDLVRLAVIPALGGDLWRLRCAADYEAARERSREHAVDELDALLERLDELAVLDAKIRTFRHKMHSGSAEFTVLDNRLQWLFRPGFLRIPEAFANYPRYLKALSLRAERMLGDPARDRSKGEAIAPLWEKFLLTARTTPGGMAQNDALREFYLLLEEAEIACYTPEIRTRGKCTPAVLEQVWREIRL